MRTTPDAVNLVLVLALATACLSSSCSTGEGAPPAPPDASAQIRVLKSSAGLEESQQALDELIAMGPAVVPQIADALRSLPPATDGSWLGEALFAFGEDAAPAGAAVFSRLVLGTNTAHVMASVLAVSGPKGQELLVRSLSPAHPEACLVAALIKVETDTNAAVLAVARLTEHESPDVREEALLRLGDYTEPDRSLRLDAVRAALRDESDAVRVAAVETATNVATRDDTVIADALGDLLARESEEWVLRAALEAVLSIKARSPRLRRGIASVVDGSDGKTSAEAAAALRELFPG